ncbi:coiled-coil domain-containing protein SCD2-like isoform X1 [Typha angustifolia]|uniref:coiled-coil domain-containing protein SCD2-like isoform X1 n=1 Tax=Typha angustifolia TaxID=59011 RepID=UPI003C2BB6A4
MDRRRAGSPAYGQQGSSGYSEPSSPAYSLASGRRAERAKAVSAFLAKRMVTPVYDDDDDDDDEHGRGGARGGLIPAIVGGGGGATARYRTGSPRMSGMVSNGFGGGGGGYGLERVGRNSSPKLGQKLIEPTPVGRTTSTGRPSLSIRTTPSIMPSSYRTPSALPAIEVPVTRRNDRRVLPDIGHLNSREPVDSRETSALRDEVDMLQEENEKLLNGLRLAEQKFEEAEARSRELEKQVSNLGEGLSLEVRLMKRKEAMLLQKEKEIRDAMQTKDDTKGEEVAALHQQVQSAREEVATAVQQLREAESEGQALRSMTQRMILTKEEMEEVELKRCWLSRYWGLAVQYGIYPEIAVSKHEHWSSLAPRPFDVVISAGQRAKEEGNVDPEGGNKFVHNLSDLTGEGNIESMLSVEKGLRELASLKVEDAVILALAHDRRPNLLWQTDADLKSPGDPKFMEAFDLHQEEVEDVLFKQAWLIYFWRRAKDHLVEEDIAEERLQFWIDRLGQQPTSHDAVDVERGLIELRKLSIEQLLWEASHKDFKANQNEST